MKLSAFNKYLISMIIFELNRFPFNSYALSQTQISLMAQQIKREIFGWVARSKESSTRYHACMHDKKRNKTTFS